MSDDKKCCLLQQSDILIKWAMHDLLVHDAYYSARYGTPIDRLYNM